MLCHLWFPIVPCWFSPRESQPNGAAEVEAADQVLSELIPQLGSQRMKKAITVPGSLSHLVRIDDFEKFPGMPAFVVLALRGIVGSVLKARFEVILGNLLHIRITRDCGATKALAIELESALVSATTTPPWLES